MNIFEKLIQWLKKHSAQSQPVVTESATLPALTAPAPRENKDGKTVASSPPPPEVKVPAKPSAAVHYDKWMYPGLSRYLPDPDMGDFFPTAGTLPKGIVVHHTASYKLDPTIDWFKQNSVDIHFIIGHDGEIIQMVPCNRKAAHAGVSSWAGFNSLNNWFIGIEVVNIGWLKKVNGKFIDGYGREWKGPVRERNILGYKYWEPFTEMQEKALLDVVVWACRTFGIPSANVVAHYEASPGRKNDPAGGLALTMNDFRALIKSRIEERTEAPVAFV